jgi:hypothetical protein
VPRESEALAGVGSSSGATRRSQLIVRIALASLRLLPRRLAMRLLHMSCIAVSACRLTLDIKGESGYKLCRRLMCALRSRAEA